MKRTVFETVDGVRYSRQTQLRRLRSAIDTELTDRQRQILLEYYISQKTMCQIAQECGINKSTVCRTIQRAEQRLQRCLRY